MYKVGQTPPFSIFIPYVVAVNHTSWIHYESSVDMKTIDSDKSHPLEPPIHQFPVEILIKIFLQVLVEPMFVPFDCAPLWHLGHVCTRWRSIICLEMPLTWSTIIVNFGTSSRAARLARYSADIVRVCLQRTRDCPLTIAFNCAKPRDDRLRCLDMLVRVSERWKVIDLFIPIAILSRLLPAKGRLGILETLNLILEPRNVHSLPHVLDVFEDAPKLTAVTTSSHLSLESFRLPWKQITNYRTQSVEADNCVEIFHLAPHLRTLQIRFERSHGGIPGTFTSSKSSNFASRSDQLTSIPISHQVLTSLSINVLMRPEYEQELFQSLLQVSSDLDKSNQSHVFFPSLTDFRLATTPDFLANFAVLPLAASCFGSSLTKVTIRSVFDTPAHYLGANGFLLGLPMVRQLAFGVCSHHKEDEVKVLYGILSLPFTSSMREAVLPKLETLRGKGVDAMLAYKPYESNDSIKKGQGFYEAAWMCASAEVSPLSRIAKYTARILRKGP
ncbi:hypothetical protein J3R30DRAFT_3404466 [Lentinula aciculospora]|uniref:F-box domain-containing protein n=1 Tax=Lentinula aciculospora TaxID=153920 RepID=A0A9W9DP65_9AGAR|nr:hypothetical protein J3R30DRAFT_3404466 [Lentinula aciculospora]